MKTDRRLVKDIEYIDKLAAKLCGQTYALALATRQSRRGSIELKIAQANINKKTQTGGYLLYDFARYLPVAVVETLKH